MSQSKALPDGRASAMPSLTVGLLPCSTPYAVTGFLFLASNKQGSDTMPRQEPYTF